VSLTSVKKIGIISGATIMIANMVGVGVYTSLGYQLLGINSTLAIIMLWAVGGLVALCGALTYAELAVVFPRSGGEYNFLSRIYHPAIGFLSGWVSITVGFAAPMAASAMAFGDYFQNILEMDQKLLAVLVILGITIINLLSFSVGKKFQASVTIMNISLITAFIVFGWIFSDSAHFKISLGEADIADCFSQSFAISLIYVSFAYSGWNSITYIADDIDQPQKNIPKILLLGTSVVLLLYVALNFIFLYSTPKEEFLIAQPGGGWDAQVKIALIAAQNIFHKSGIPFIVMILCIGFIASVNSMMIIGPRVSKVVGKDVPLLRFLSKETNKEVPVISTLVQTGIALLMILTSSFDEIITYIGFTLSIFTTLTVIGVFIIRKRKLNQPGQYKTLGFPLTPIIFISLELWMIYNVVMDKGKLIPSLVTLGIILLGLIIYFANSYIYKKSEN
jgi:basic amino acid/polyamine antiporter, APA family